MIQKILIANRGEIAIRIMKACRKLGIVTVAVFSDADKRAPHTEFADEAIWIGPSESKESYLSIEKMIRAAKTTKADAIHPGYGFLSENSKFAAVCESEGLIFIGPRAETIEKMGNKSTAKALMEKAGVPVVPGFHAKGATLETLQKKAGEIGFPILIKAAAGGGGKGMRIVEDKKDVVVSLEAAAREAEKSFADGSLLIEKYLPKARHIEVQILGDKKGNCIHLFERECSLQRRYQKILEETPAPGLDPKIRQKVLDAAVAAGKAVSYENAGTVEFVVGGGQFYFLEMNTRLQVEHRVTEQVTGLDLVEWQIRVSEGKTVPEQAQIQSHGHSLEVRLYAEEPEKKFLPCSGMLTEWKEPELTEGFLIDSGVKRGVEVGIYYDPLLAKLVTHSDSRETSFRKMHWLLNQISVQGLNTNQKFLQNLVKNPEVLKGQVHTQFVESNLAELLTKMSDETRHRLLSAVAIFYFVKAKTKVLTELPLGFRNNPYGERKMGFVTNGVEELLFLKVDRGTIKRIRIGEWVSDIELISIEENQIEILLGDYRLRAEIKRTKDKFTVHSTLGSLTADLVSRFPLVSPKEKEGGLRAPMTGKVMRVFVKRGQKFKAGEALVIVEAMKMEQTVHAQESGTIKEIHVKEGDMVQSGVELVEVEVV